MPKRNTASQITLKSEVFAICDILVKKRPGCKKEFSVTEIKQLRKEVFGKAGRSDYIKKYRDEWLKHQISTKSETYSSAPNIDTNLAKAREFSRMQEKLNSLESINKYLIQRIQSLERSKAQTSKQPKTSQQGGDSKQSQKSKSINIRQLIEKTNFNKMSEINSKLEQIISNKTNHSKEIKNLSRSLMDIRVLLMVLIKQYTLSHE